MDKIALIADSHGNLTALQTVLDDIKKREIKHIYCLGDIAIKGTNPNEVTEPTDLANTVEEDEDQEVGLIASYDDQVMEILDGSINGDTLTVRIRFTNNSSDGFYALESFACMAYQDGIELEEVTDINDDEMGAALIRGVKNGVSIEGEYKFTIYGDSDIEFFICTPTAEEKILAKKVFTQ